VTLFCILRWPKEMNEIEREYEKVDTERDKEGRGECGIGTE
jgi:hypothetical protein